MYLCFRIFSNALLLFTITSLVVYPLADIPQIQTEALEERISETPFLGKELSYRSITYDDVLELLDEIESGSIDDCSPEEKARINEFIDILAERGMLPNETDQSLEVLNMDMVLKIFLEWKGR